MYNFRYHLVTICSIFVSLAIGLLLGAAIAGSDLAQNTSSNMVDSMFERFETLSTRNAQLEQEALDNANLLDRFVDPWAAGRLDGRTIVTVLGTTEDDLALADSLATDIKRANGAFVGVSVNLTDFGLSDNRIKAALVAVVPEVAGEDYRLTLAKRLAYEWTYRYTYTANDIPVAEDAQVPEVQYQASQQTEGQIEQETQQTEGSTPTNSNADIVPQTPFQLTFFSNYTLTRALLSLGIITVQTDYDLLLEHQGPAIPSEQASALALARSWHLPYAINGMVNGLVTTTNNTTEIDQLALLLTQQFNERGSAGSLPYPDWLRPYIPASTSGDISMPNYYAVLVQANQQSEPLTAAAAANGLSCVTSPKTATGRYSLLVLLSGGQAGIYGENRPFENRFPELPQDISGRSVFR
ncbi:MAG: copper transporter [Coriobacteriales bacterium]|jgi:hypothetical protein|nr:copper transporter [Coriobacteriales bacterium]